MRSKQRRRILCAALAGAGGVLLGAAPRRLAVAQQGPEPLRANALRGELTQLSGSSGNIVALKTSSGVLMVDSGAPEHAPSLATFMTERFGGAAVEVLLNTHWHLAHTGGNEAVGGGRAKIIAHENTRLWMSTQFFVDWQSRTYEPRPAAARPNATFHSSQPQPIELAHGGVRLRYGLLREAHTDGDIYVHFPAENVIVAGGAVTVDRYPVLDYSTGGAMRGLLDATQALIDMSDAQTLIVPAVGPPQRRRHLELQREMVATVLERLQTFARQGKSSAEMLSAGITAEFDAYWGDNAERFIANAYNSLWGISG